MTHFVGIHSHYNIDAVRSFRSYILQQCTVPNVELFIAFPTHIIMPAVAVVLQAHARSPLSADPVLVHLITVPVISIYYSVYNCSIYVKLNQFRPKPKTFKINLLSCFGAFFNVPKFSVWVYIQNNLYPSGKKFNCFV